MIFIVMSLIADFFACISVIVMILVYFNDKKRANKLATLDAYNRLQCDVFDVLNQWEPSVIRKAMNDHQSEEYVELSSLLARIEHFCAGINHNIYDYKIFRDVSKGYFGSTRGKLYGRILPILEEKTDGDNPKYYNNLISLWQRMSEEQDDSD